MTEIPEIAALAFAGRKYLTPKEFASIFRTSNETIDESLRRGILPWNTLGTNASRFRCITVDHASEYWDGISFPRVEPYSPAPSPRAVTPRSEFSAARAGFIYFVGFADFIKIGWSKNVKERVEWLQVGAPLKLQLYATMPGAPGAEHWLHRKFHGLRLNGEWFRATPELFDSIESFREARLCL